MNNWTEWIGLPANDDSDELIGAVLAAHRKAALENENVSSIALCLNASVQAAFPQCVASALQTLGGPVHGPAQDARELIYGWDDEEIHEFLVDGNIIPGWGNSFFKEGIDPAWAEVDALLRLKYAEHLERVDAITALVSDVKGTPLFPNAAAFTGVTAHVVGIPIGLEMLLVILGRLPAWGMQFMSQRNR
jgi:citrate synthase